jgi:hypothetical protein
MGFTQIMDDTVKANDPPAPRPPHTRPTTPAWILDPPPHPTLPHPPTQTHLVLLRAPSAP